MGAIAASKPVLPLRVLPLRTLSDERLAELASTGHSDAFGTLYERYRDALSRYCRSIVRDTEDAGDALQNTMLSVLRSLQGRGPTGPVRPWLYRIAHNESISMLRRRHPQEELSAETPDRVDTEYASFTRVRLDALLSDLMALPENQRGALVMRELGGLEYSEIGNALDMSPVAARKHVFEARVALHDIADGRDANCTDIVKRISDGDGRVLRARSVRGHLRGCPSCSAFERGLRARRGTLALIPPLPLASTGAILAAVLHGGGAATTSGFATGGSVAGGTVAGGSIAAGSFAAAGSLLGGGSFVAIKGIVAAGAIAVAGAGVIVGTGISSHATQSQPSAAVVSHAARVHRAHAVTAAPLPAAQPIHLAVAHAAAAPAPRLATTVPVTSTPSASHEVSAVVAVPRASAPAPSKPNTQAPAVAPPAAMTSPTTTPTPAPTTTTPTTASPAPAPTTTTAATPATATSLWIDAIIAGALKSAGADVAAAETQAQQQIAQVGATGTTATSMAQSIIASILAGFHG
jgi:RNA polymerase sigma factor (sigma-70 family)